jgi:pimeloyl-ACP methyl ester carboxylesterase
LFTAFASISTASLGEEPQRSSAETQDQIIEARHQPAADRLCRSSNLAQHLEMKMKSILSAVVFSAAAVGAGGAALAQEPAKNIVLVHGAFADASSWDKVAGILSAKGYHVTQVANPLTSLADDVAATRAALDAQDGPTVLVGHSWGGVVIGEAGADEKVKALVYVSAFAPDKGETLNKLLSGGEPSEGGQGDPSQRRGGPDLRSRPVPRAVRRRPAGGGSRGQRRHAVAVEPGELRRRG